MLSEREFRLSAAYTPERYRAEEWTNDHTLRLRQAA